MKPSINSQSPSEPRAGIDTEDVLPEIQWQEEKETLKTPNGSVSHIFVQEVPQDDVQFEQYINKKFAAGNYDKVKSLVLDRLQQDCNNRLFWHYIFDVLKVMADRETYNLCCSKFIRIFGETPPEWSEIKEQEAVVPSGRGTLIFSGQFNGLITDKINDFMEYSISSGVCSFNILNYDAINSEPFASRVIIGLLNTLKAKKVITTLIFNESISSLVHSGNADGNTEKNNVLWLLELEHLSYCRKQKEHQKLAEKYVRIFGAMPPDYETYAVHREEVISGVIGPSHPVLSSIENMVKIDCSNIVYIHPDVLAALMANDIMLKNENNFIAYTARDVYAKQGR